MEFKKWLGSPDELNYHKHMVDDFVNHMANNLYNAVAILFMLDNRGQYDSNKLRYRGPIANHLLAFNSNKLGEAKGLVIGSSAYEKPVFKFYVKGPKAGNIDIIHPPVIYDNSDIVLMHGIILHELRHAQDYANDKPVDTTNYYFNEAKYLESESEVRSYVDQLRYLLKTLGSQEKVMAAISQYPKMEPITDTGRLYAKVSPFRWPVALQQAAEVFFKHLMKEEITPPAIVRTEESNIPILMAAIFKKMALKNFVLKK